MGELGNVLSEERDFLRNQASNSCLCTCDDFVTHEDEESLEDVKQLASTSLVAGLYTLTDNIDHRWKELLEGFLQKR